MNNIRKSYRVWWGLAMCIVSLPFFFFHDFLTTDTPSPTETEISLAMKSNYTDFINYKNKTNSTSLFSAILIHSGDIDFIEKTLLFYKEKGDVKMINQAVRLLEAVSSSQINLAHLPEYNIKKIEQKISMLKKQKVYNKLDLYLFIYKDYLYLFVSFILPVFVFTIIVYLTYSK